MGTGTDCAAAADVEDLEQLQVKVAVRDDQLQMLREQVLHSAGRGGFAFRQLSSAKVGISDPRLSGSVKLNDLTQARGRGSLEQVDHKKLPQLFVPHPHPQKEETQVIFSPYAKRRGGLGVLPDRTKHISPQFWGLGG